MVKYHKLFQVLELPNVVTSLDYSFGPPDYQLSLLHPSWLLDLNLIFRSKLCWLYQSCLKMKWLVPVSSYFQFLFSLLINLHQHSSFICSFVLKFYMLLCTTLVIFSPQRQNLSAIWLASVGNCFELKHFPQKYPTTFFFSTFVLRAKDTRTMWFISINN